MVSYPKLSEAQQKNLPALLAPAKPLAAKFEDSTHQLWVCETAEGMMVLKTCNQESIVQSTFWQGVNSLFAINFPVSLANIAFTHRYLRQHGQLDVPEFIASEASSFVMSRLLSGNDVHAELVTDEMVKQLAQHLGQLHQHTYTTWGRLDQPALSAARWSERLQKTIVELVENHSLAIPQSIVDMALAQVGQLHISEFVTIMADFRWDQLLHNNQQLSAIVDLDAFVVGPKELEFTVLEYQLNAAQARVFKNTYQYYSELPDLSAVRPAYRLLLFLMNALGEIDLNRWMQHPIHF